MEESNETVGKVLKEGLYQYCPRASTFTKEWNERLKCGLSIRAWGAENEELMNKMLTFGVDGMTVNYPDKLQKAILL